MLHRIAEQFAGLMSQSDAAHGVTAVLNAASVRPRIPMATGDLPCITLSITTGNASQRDDDAAHPRTRFSPMGRFARPEEVRNGIVQNPLRFGDTVSGVTECLLHTAADSDAEALAGRLLERLYRRDWLREHGFSLLVPVRFEAREWVRLTPATGSPFSAWRQRIDLRFACEILDPLTPTGEGIIRQVDVDITGETPDDFAIPPRP